MMEDKFRETMEKSIREVVEEKRLREEKTREEERVREGEMKARLQLARNTPAQIEEELSRHVVGQPVLVKDVADFVYYHWMRQIHPELPHRPILISGPSGCGKTEVWRTVSQLFDTPLQVVDGTKVTNEGWSGGCKVSTILNSELCNGGILVIDEFDKLATPSYTSKGENVSQKLQAELLKLLEGEYVQNVTVNRKSVQLDTKKLDIVFVGAFEGIYETKTVQPVGFNRKTEITYQTDTPDVEAFLRFGVMPEIMGRIAVISYATALSDEAYLQILQNPYSRIAAIRNILKGYGFAIQEILPEEEIRELILKSRQNRTGFRWVSAQLESRLLEVIHTVGLYDLTPSNGEQ